MINKVHVKANHSPFPQVESFVMEKEEELKMLDSWTNGSLAQEIYILAKLRANGESEMPFFHYNISSGKVGTSFLLVY